MLGSAALLKANEQNNHVAYGCSGYTGCQVISLQKRCNDKWA